MRISAVLCFVFLFICCSRENTISSRPYEGELKNKGNFTMYFDYEAINSGYHSLRYFKDETTHKEYLTLLAMKLNQIQFYDIKTGKLEKSIPVSANADSYVIVNYDSIFVFQSGTSFHLCNSKGKILKNFDFGYLMKKSEGRFIEQSAFFNDPQYKNGKLYLRVVNNENYYTESGVLVLKFNNGGLESGVMTALYPDWFAKEYENYNMSLPVFAVKGDTVLMSYEVEHDVFYYQE